MIDAVATHPHSPLTCGVTKFSHQLAAQLGVPCVPCVPIGPVAIYRRPLISIKTAEWADWALDIPARLNSYDLFLHDSPSGIAQWPQSPHPWHSREVITRAWRVIAASAQIAEHLYPFRQDVIPGFCPSTVQGNLSRGAYHVLAFGMAHKLALSHFRSLKRDLDREHPDYTVSLSTAVHEGNPWDQALTDSTQAMRQIFGDRLRVLGYLGDDALAKELHECDAVAVYFDPAVRENNTSIWAALAAGKPVYTNTDEHSPPLDHTQYSWPKLLEVLS